MFVSHDVADLRASWSLSSMACEHGGEMPSVAAVVGDDGLETTADWLPLRLCIGIYSSVGLRREGFDDDSVFGHSVLTSTDVGGAIV
jgi:hypothetical protein